MSRYVYTVYHDAGWCHFDTEREALVFASQVNAWNIVKGFKVNIFHKD